LNSSLIAMPTTFVIGDYDKSIPNCIANAHDQDATLENPQAQNAFNGLWLNDPCRNAYIVGENYTHAIRRPEVHLVGNPGDMSDQLQKS
jgi:hypothetical protein